MIRLLGLPILAVALFKGLYALLSSEIVGGKAQRVVMDRFGLIKTPLVYLLLSVFFTLAGIIGFDLDSEFTLSVFVCLTGIGFYGYRVSRERLLEKCAEKNTEQIRGDVKQLDNAMSQILSLVVSLSAMVFIFPQILVYGAFGCLTIVTIIYGICSVPGVKGNEFLAYSIQNSS